MYGALMLKLELICPVASILPLAETVFAVSVPAMLAVLAVRLSAADVEVKSPEPSALADAVQQGDAQRVQALIKNRVNVNAQQPEGETALHWAD